MPSAITPKVPLTVVANQGIAGMATTVQVSACEVLHNIIYLGLSIIAVTVTAHTELLGPVTVPSLIRNRPLHRGLRSHLFTNSTWVLVDPKIYLCQDCEMGPTIYRVLIREH